MNKKLIGVVIAVILIVAAVVLMSLNKKDVQAPSAGETIITDSNSGETVPEEPTETAETSATATIVFTNDGFTPNTLSVKKGTVVTVKNESSKRVQFSSDDHPTHRLNTEMNLKTLSAGESATFTADTVGTHGFHDHIDDSKTGTLIVTE